MKINRITLFVMGQQNSDGSDMSKAVSYTSADLWKEIDECIGQLCDHGSREAVCRTAYNGAIFDPYLTGAVGKVRTNSNAMAVGVQATQLCVIYMINSAMDAQVWARCVSETHKAVTAMGFQQITHMALIQRDGLELNHPDLIQALNENDAAVYLFSQNTQNGWMLITGYEERKLLSYYAVMAAGGLLPENHGVYTGSYNKLSLTEEDFRRIRTHYAVSGLTARLLDRGERLLTDEQLFSDFIGAWVGGGIGPNSNYEDIGNSLTNRIKPMFPDSSFASIMANENITTMDNNIEKFIELNFEGDWLKALLLHFEDQDVPTRGKYSPSIILQDWHTHFNKVMDDHPEYYCREVADYLRDKLLPWLQGQAKKLRSATIQPVQCELKDVVAYAIAKTERSLKPYYNKVAAALLMSICRKLAECVDDIYVRVRARDQMIHRNKWLLSESELKYDYQYARRIMDQIENRSRTSIRPQDYLTPSHDFFGDGEDVQSNWADLVNRLQQNLEDKTVQGLIDVLNEAETSEFTRTVSEHVRDIGVRLNIASASVRQEERRVVYVCSTRLHLDDNGRKLPKDGDLCRIVQARFDNLLEFSVYGLVANDDSEADIGILLGLIGGSERYNDTVHTQDSNLMVETPTVEIVEAAKAEKMSRFEVQGSSLRVRLPKIFAQEEGVKANLKWVLSGYTADNLKAAPLIRTQHVSGIEINIALGTFYGRCRIELTCEALGYHEVHEFTGQKVSRPLLYSKKRPFMIKKQRLASVGNDTVSFERWVCKLDDDRVRSIEALVNLNPSSNAPFYYPVGDAGEWSIWLPKDASGEFYLETGDESRVYTMEEKD